MDAGQALDLLANPDSVLFRPPAVSSYDANDGHLIRYRLPRSRLAMSDQGWSPMFVLQPPDPDVQFPRCVLYFHSNGCDIGGARGEALRLCFELNATVVLPEYPGYGLNADSKPSIDGVDDVCLAAFEYASEELGVPVDNIVIFGRSIGTGPACRLAAHVAQNLKQDVGAVILIAPFTSVRRMVEERAPHPVPGPVVAGVLMPYAWDNKSELSSVKAPLFVVHGQLDETIPVSHGRLLLARSPSEVKEGSFPHDWKHNCVADHQLTAITESVRDFVAQHIGAFSQVTNCDPNDAKVDASVLEQQLRKKVDETIDALPPSVIF